MSTEVEEKEDKKVVHIRVGKDMRMNLRLLAVRNDLTTQEMLLKIIEVGYRYYKNRTDHE